MKNFDLTARVAGACLLTLCLTLAQADEDDGWIDLPCMYPHSDGNCPTGSFLMLFPDGTEPSLNSFCSTSVGSSCIPLGYKVPPSPAWIDCGEPRNGHVTCQAWPQGDLAFDWVVSEPLMLIDQDNPDNHSIQVRCLSAAGTGLISVTIITPERFSDVAFGSVNCGGNP